MASNGNKMAAADRIKQAAMNASKGLSRAQAERAATAAARNVNAYGQKEEGPSRWQERKEAKRMMYLESTEQAVKLGERKQKGASSNPGNQMCQKCYKTGHWTYECKNERVYVTRPSRTQQLKNPKLRQKYMDSTEVLDGLDARGREREKAREGDVSRGKDKRNGEKKSKKERRKKVASDSEASSSSDYSSDETDSTEDSGSDDESGSDSGSDSELSESSGSYDRRKRKRTSKSRSKKKRQESDTESDESDDESDESDESSEDDGRSHREKKKSRKSGRDLKSSKRRT